MLSQLSCLVQSILPVSTSSFRPMPASHWWRLEPGSERVRKGFGLASKLVSHIRLLYKSNAEKLQDCEIFQQ